jgi:GDPmannose 4,6-dehydratase
LLREGWDVHAIARREPELDRIPESPEQRGRFFPHRLDILDAAGITELIAATKPHEIYNLAGQSSVSKSFAEPAETWRTNAEAVRLLLEAVRHEAPMARLYQSSSGEMFGWDVNDKRVHDESSPLAPNSPYAAAKAAAHVLCATYRRVLGVRVACGIAFNHESHRRPSDFLTRRVIEHVRRIRASPSGRGGSTPLAVGNLRAQRDWGYAPDYVDGMIAVLRQVRTRSDVRGDPSPEADIAENYRDYVLATGNLQAVWQLIDQAFSLVGIGLSWEMDSDDVKDWRACYSDSGEVAVTVDPSLLRPSDPVAISANPSLARRELGWRPRGLDQILKDMLEHA